MPIDLVRHDLADREDQVVPAFPHQPVELRGPRLAVDAFGGLGHELGRHLADRDHVVAPVVDAEQPLGHAGKHAVQLPVGHGDVRAQGRHDVGQPVAEILVGHAGQRPGHAVGPGEIGRQGQHLPPRLQLAEMSRPRPRGGLRGSSRSGASLRRSRWSLVGVRSKVLDARTIFSVPRSGAPIATPFSRRACHAAFAGSSRRIAAPLIQPVVSAYNEMLYSCV